MKKIYEKIKMLINGLLKVNSSMPEEFKSEFKIWKKSIDHLFSEFDSDVRNEYEHPTLKAHSVGNTTMWGTIKVDALGNVKAHVGGERFADIKKKHCEKVQELRTDLFDIFLKHFSQKSLTQELIKVKDYIEKHVDSLSEELKDLKVNKNLKSFNTLLSQFTLYDINLSKEGLPLSAEVRNKFYSILSELSD